MAQKQELGNRLAGMLYLEGTEELKLSANQLVWVIDPSCTTYNCLPLYECALLVLVSLLFGGGDV